MYIYTNSRHICVYTYVYMYMHMMYLNIIIIIIINYIHITCYIHIYVCVYIYIYTYIHPFLRQRLAVLRAASTRPIARQASRGDKEPLSLSLSLSL